MLFHCVKDNSPAVEGLIPVCTSNPHCFWQILSAHQKYAFPDFSVQECLLLALPFSEATTKHPHQLQQDNSKAVLKFHVTCIFFYQTIFTGLLVLSPGTILG